jgi:hypothetical protein
VAADDFEDAHRFALSIKDKREPVKHFFLTSTEKFPLIFFA